MCLTIPVAFGIYVNYRWPKQSKIILKVSSSINMVVNASLDSEIEKTEEAITGTEKPVKYSPAPSNFP